MSGRGLRVGLFHNLGPGGALRAAHELVRHTSNEVSYTLHRVIEGGGSADLGLDWSSYVDEIVEHPLQYPLHGRFGEAETAVRLSPLLRLYSAIGRAIDDRRYDAVFVHHCWYLSSPSFLTQLGTPSVFYVQEPRRPSFEYNRRPTVRSNSRVPVPAQQLFIASYEALVRRLDLRSVRSADRLLCNSRYSAESILRAYGRPSTLCPLGVDSGTFEPEQADERDDYVLAVGALDPTKGADLIIDAVAMLPKEIRPQLVVVGNRVSDAVVAHLEALAGRVDVDLRIETALSDSELARRYAKALATIAAAELEPFGLTTIESLACGTPVVALAEGGYREVVVDGLNGVTVDRDVSSLARGIEHVLRGELGASRDELRSSVTGLWTWERSAEVVMRTLWDVSHREVGA